MPPLDDSALATVKRLRDAGHLAYYAGGCVRDRLIGRPVHEIDIATSARPDEIERLFEKTIPVGKAFGVIVVVDGDCRFEVATFRSDGPYLDGRHPSTVRFTGVDEDVARRDFTINGMMYDPVKDELIDLVGGRADLERRVIRAIGDPHTRFEEDRLRMLRAVRFACQLGFAIDEPTEVAIRSLAHRIVEVSWERIRGEMEGILLSPRASEGFRLLKRMDLLRHILPEVAALENVPQPPDWHPEGDVWTHTLLCLDSLRDPSFELALATLLHDVGKPRTMVISDRIRFNGHDAVGGEMALEICRRLRLSTKSAERVAWLVGRHMFFKDLSTMRKATIRRLVAHPFFSDLIELHRADVLGGNGDLSAYNDLLRMREDWPPSPRPPAPLLDGNDLIAMGLAPGPDFKRILREIEDARLEGRLKTREDAIAFVRAVMIDHGRHSAEN